VGTKIRASSPIAFKKELDEYEKISNGKIKVIYVLAKKDET